jgi:tRNA/tmRNA/rRNA uracil-C5-methylase (TrmA/RlmC/RlmD family)
MKSFQEYLTEQNENPYNWKKNYGKRFKIAVTPSEQSNGEDLVSIVTPANQDAWNWPEAHPTIVKRFRKNWNKIQKTLEPHKRRQIETGKL